MGLHLTNSTVVTGVAVAGFGGYGISITSDNNSLSCSWLGTTNGQTADGNAGGGISLSGNNNRLGEEGQPASGDLIRDNCWRG